MDLQREFESECRSLRDRVLFLGAEVEQALDRARLSFVDRDIEIASSVISHNEAIDQIEVYIDRECLNMLAHPGPIARDLHFALSMIKIAPFLERIADHASCIAKIVIDLNEQPTRPIVPEIDAMSHHALSMLRSGLEAVTSKDPVAARRVIESETEIDHLYNHAVYSLHALIVSEPTLATFHTRQLIVAKHIERIGNYITDICHLTVEVE